MAAKSKPDRCSICKQPTRTEFQPFCSKRCADVDLHRWFSGAYAIPTAEGPDEDSSESKPQQQ